MKKTISKVKNEIAKIIADVAMIDVSRGDKLDKESKNNALNSLQKLQDELEEYKKK